MHAFLQLAPVRARAAMAARRRPRRLSRRGTAKAAPRPMAALLEVRRPMSADLICATDETSCRCEAARWRPRKPLRIPRRIKRGGVGVPPVLAGSNLSGRRFDTPARHHRTFARRGFLRLRRCGSPTRHGRSIPQTVRHDPAVLRQLGHHGLVERDVLLSAAIRAGMDAQLFTELLTGAEAGVEVE